MYVLIVDDDVATVEVIRDSVTWAKLGVENVATAHNVTAAKQVLLSEPVDIVISDVEMPQGSGIDLLNWIRQEKIDCEFILLTCHENFNYASRALKLDAAEYLVKPFDTASMELSLRSVIRKIYDTQSLRQSSEYGRWVADNPRRMQLSFWSDLLSGKITPESERINREIKDRRLVMNANEEYCLVLVKFTNTDQEEKKLGLSLLQFAFESIVSEILCASVENERVVQFSQAGKTAFVAALSGLKQEEIKNRCQFLLNTSSMHFTSTVTCCVSNGYSLNKLPQAAEHVAEIMAQSIAFYGEVFTENDAKEHIFEEHPVLNLDVVAAYLEDRDKAAFLNYLKNIMQEQQKISQLSEHLLSLVKQEILQVVYAYMMPRGINASRLFFDQTSESMFARASQSATDMIRWINFLLEKTWNFEEELKKSGDIVERIHAHIHKHYMEEMGRNEIAAEFFLAPEYLSRLYKKKTGNALNDYLNEYRISKAKQLLQNEELLISDVAEAVGFSNLSYFSTIFKKYEKISPNDFRKSTLEL